jgi:hypothetical protein
MNRNMTRCLFGGALVGAGVCSTASADFVWGSSVVSRANSISTQPSVFSTAGGWDDSTSFGTSYTETVGNAFGMSMLVFNGNTAASRIQAYRTAFSVTVDTAVTIEWDFTASVANSYTTAYILLIDASTNITFFERANGGPIPTVGSAVITLLASESYLMRGYAGANNGLTSISMSSNISVVPLPPGSLAGLGVLVGLCAYRRVRR